MDKLQQVRRLALERSLVTNAKRDEHMHKMALNLRKQETLSVFGGNSCAQAYPLSHACGLNRVDDLEDKENKTSELGSERELNRTGKRPVYQPLDGVDSVDDPASTLGHIKNRSQNIATTNGRGAASTDTPGTRGVITRSRAKKQKTIEGHDIRELRHLRIYSVTPPPTASTLSDDNKGQESTSSPSIFTCSDDKGQGSTSPTFRFVEVATDPLNTTVLSNGVPSGDTSSYPEPMSSKAFNIVVEDPPSTEESQTQISSSSEAKNDRDWTPTGNKQSAPLDISFVQDANETLTTGATTDTENAEKATAESVLEPQTRVGHRDPGKDVGSTAGEAMYGDPIRKDLRLNADPTTTLDEGSPGIATASTPAIMTATATLPVSDIALKSTPVPVDDSRAASDMEFSGTETPAIRSAKLTNNSDTGSTVPGSTAGIVDTDDDAADMDISGSDDGTDDMDISDSDLPSMGPADETEADSDVEAIGTVPADLDAEETESNDGDIDDVDDLLVVKAGASKPWKGLKRLKIFTDEAYKGKWKARAVLRKVNRLAAESTAWKIETWVALGFAAPTPEQKTKPLGHVAFAKSDANRPSWDEWWVQPFTP